MMRDCKSLYSNAVGLQIRLNEKRKAAPSQVD